MESSISPVSKSGRDAEEADAPVAGAQDMAALKKEIQALTTAIQELKSKQP